MSSFLISVKKQFESYRSVGEKTFDQVSDEKLLWQINEESNSMAMIVKHMHGNMLSRWTDFLTSDGEKSWRKREEEFVNDIKTKAELISKWNEGWECLFQALETLTDKDLDKEIYIRNIGQTVMDAINRQLAHYSYHIGQIVFLGKVIKNETWRSLSIPKGKSIEYNSVKFSKPKS